MLRPKRKKNWIWHLNIFKFALEWLFRTITATITGETSLFMILENPCVYISKRVCDSVCDSSSIWTSIMIPWAREFLQCYIFVLAICDGLCYVAKAKLCVSPTLQVLFGVWGVGVGQIWPFFIKTLCFVIVDDCWCHSMSVFVECELAALQVDWN